jgi:hypothetical protein
MIDGQSASFSMCKSPSWPQIIFLLLSESWRIVDVGRPLWREDNSVIYSCFWLSPAQPFKDLSTAGLLTIICCLRFQTPQPGGPDSRIYIRQEQGGPVIPLGTGLTSGAVTKVKVTLQLTVSQSLCQGMEPTLRFVTRYYFLSEGCCLVSVGRPLWREVGSVICHSKPKVVNSIYIKHLRTQIYIYIYTRYIYIYISVYIKHLRTQRYIIIQFVHHRNHITSPLWNPTG